MPEDGENESVVDPIEEMDPARYDDDETDPTPEEKPEEDATTEGPPEGEGEEESTEAEPEKTAEAEPDSFNPKDLEIAEMFGLPEAAARGFGTPEALLKHLQALHKTAPAESGGKTEKEESPPPDPAFKLQIPEFDPAEYGEEVVKAWKQVEEMHLHHTASAQAMRDEIGKQLGQATQTINDMANRMFMADFDHWLTKQPDAYDEMLGKEPSREVARESPYYANRSKVIDTAVQLAELRASKGMPVPDTAALLNQARDIVFSGKSKEIARKELKAEVAKRNGKAVPKPAAERGKPDRGSRRARVSAVAEYLEKAGVSTDGREEFG